MYGSSESTDLMILGTALADTITMVGTIDVVFGSVDTYLLRHMHTIGYHMISLVR